MNEFDVAVAEFEKGTVAALQAKITAGEEVVAFIGRATCPFCRRFAPKMSEARQQLAIHAYFVNSEEVTELATLRDFREEYGIKTVPGLLVSRNGQTRVVCDSSISVEEIIAFIQAV